MKRKPIISATAALFLLLIAVWVAGTILSAPYQQEVGPLPSEIRGETVEFSSSSGATLHGWFLPGKPGTGAILLMHGVRATRLSMLDRARFLNQAGYSVLLFDFQAHGESTGDHITFGYLESKDAQAATRLIRTLAPGEKVGLIGVSMGGAAALLAGSRLDVQALVLEEVYPRINQAITNRLTMRLGGWARVLTPALSLQLKPRLGVAAEDLCPVNKIGEVTAPKLLIAGAEDQRTTLEESKELFRAASEPKELWVVEGASHVDLCAFAREEYQRRVLQFFEKCLK